MRNQGMFLAVFGLVLILAFPVDSYPAPGKGKGGIGFSSVTAPHGVTLLPRMVRTPNTEESNVVVCVTKSTEGNYVSVSVPWWGSPDLHTVLGYGQFVDATGGFCVKPPPDWPEMNLELGTYPLKTIWYPSNTSPDHRKGPDTTFEVMGN